MLALLSNLQGLDKSDWTPGIAVNSGMPIIGGIFQTKFDRIHSYFSRHLLNDTFDAEYDLWHAGRSERVHLGSVRYHFTRGNVDIVQIVARKHSVGRIEIHGARKRPGLKYQVGLGRSNPSIFCATHLDCGICSRNGPRTAEYLIPC